MTSQIENQSEFLSRRSILTLGAAGLTLAALPLSAGAETEDFDRVKAELFGDREIRDGRVNVELPPIAENGNSVSIDITVDSPMTNADHVRQIVILSPVNPEALIAKFSLTPASGKAAVSTRIRMSGSQGIEVIAEMSDGSHWSGTKQTIVTLAACVIG